jgi:flavin reductase (DIM6/NTAB) family NADH-FMN oxidoreductase RutF
MTDHEHFLVTAADKGIRNGQIATWIFKSSLVTDPQRIIFVVSALNYTYTLLSKNGMFRVHLLNREQADLVPRFGLVSGKTVNKFKTVPCTTDEMGIPIIEETCGWALCRVLSDTDEGDRHIIIAEIVDHMENPGKIPLRKSYLPTVLPPETIKKLQEKQVNDGIRDKPLLKKYPAS